jgi:hypothetical protein
VLIAPFAAWVYYAALKVAFALSIVGTLGVRRTVDVSSGDLTMAQWGSHWFYRLVAETCSIALGTFVAAGLARGRERTAGIAAGIQNTRRDLFEAMKRGNRDWARTRTANGMLD